MVDRDKSRYRVKSMIVKRQLISKRIDGRAFSVGDTLSAHDCGRFHCDQEPVVGFIRAGSGADIEDCFSVPKRLINIVGDRRLMYLKR